ncbi:MAG: hypothetical protein ACPG7F_17625 [Aggregatilineales bacterium]
MRQKPSQSQFVEVMAKHLPPSASNLKLLDVGAVATTTLLKLRPDIHAQPVSYNAEDWQNPDRSADAIVAYDRYLDAFFLQKALNVLRPGGRLIVVNPHEQALQSTGWRLERFGYTRILVEHAISYHGVLIRGERVHTDADTLARIQSMARKDLDLANLNDYRGRFVYLLIHQLPNKPVWRMTADDRISWKAAAVQYNAPAYLAFSSLPKAVSFMQKAVLAGRIQNVNKIPKFQVKIARNWQYDVILNPTLEAIVDYDITTIDIDRDTAEAPDE